MKITFKNNELVPAINLLQSLELKPKDSRHRSKLVNLLVEALEELKKEEMELAKRFDLLTDQGTLKKDEECDAYVITSFNLEQSVLLNEEVVISGGMHSKNIEEIPRILNDYDGKLSKVDATIYDKLLDEFEKNMVVKEGEEHEL